MACQESKLDSKFRFLYAWYMAYKDPNDERAKEAKRKHYQKNKELYKDNARQRRRAMQRYVWDAKNVPCMDCNQKFSGWVMQLDHRPNEVKVGNVSTLTTLGSWDKLKAEIEKCDVVCANCHIERTAERAGWSIDVIVEVETARAYVNMPEPTITTA